MSFHIGQRLSVGGALCTVRYIGSVKGTEKDWLGVEWDESSRGKHSGDFHGVSYFECKAPQAGSFIRPTRQIDPAQSFVESLRDKYDSGASFGSRRIEMGGKVVQEIGFEKISEKLSVLNELRIVLLDGTRIKGPAGGDTTLNQETDVVLKTCPRITELDVSRCLWEHWTSIVAVCLGLKSLKNLRANGNRFIDIDLNHSGFPVAKLSAFHTQLISLGLEETLLTWEEVVRITAPMASLQELSLSGNRFRGVGSQLLPASITTLHLERNDFTSLSDLSPLVQLPNLQNLHLRHNQISEIGKQRPVFKQRMQFVDISSNLIGEWAFLDSLNDVFPGLKSLRVSSNPLFETAGDQSGGEEKQKSSANDEIYLFTVARLGQLEILNYSKIPLQDRNNAEIYYLSSIGKELSKRSPSERVEYLKDHPRFEELCEEAHGEPTIGDNAGKVDDPTLAGRLIELLFVKPDGSELKKLKLPKTLDIYQIKGHLGRIIQKDPMELSLTLIPDDDNYQHNNAYDERDLNGLSTIGFWTDASRCRIRVNN